MVLQTLSATSTACCPSQGLAKAGGLHNSPGVQACRIIARLSIGPQCGSRVLSHHHVPFASDHSPA